MMNFGWLLVFTYPSIQRMLAMEDNDSIDSLIDIAFKEFEGVGSKLSSLREPARTIGLSFPPKGSLMPMDCAGSSRMIGPVLHRIPCS
jgi:hypothetical protein